MESAESDIAEGKVSKGWRQFMRFQIQRTRDLYEKSWSGIKFLEPEGRLAIGAASVLYSGILDEIEKNDYDVFSKRASLSLAEKLKRVPELWLKVRSL